MSTIKAANIQNPSAGSAAIVLDTSGNFSVPAGTVSAPGIQAPSDSNTGIFFPAADTIAFAEGGAEAMRIDSSSRLLVGTSSARSNFFGTTLSAVTQTEGTGGAAGRGALSVINNDVSNNPPYVLLGRSGAATLGSNAAVVSGSRLGTLTFHGADGTSFIEAATVAGEVDGTPGTNDMPGRLVFSTTTDGASSPTERFRISSTGAQSSVIPGGSTLYPSFDCRAWVNFNGTGTVAIRASGNVSSITDNGTGDYTVNFTTAMADANYSAIVTRNDFGTLAAPVVANGHTVSAGSYRVIMYRNDGAPGAYDSEQNAVAIFR